MPPADCPACQSARFRILERASDHASKVTYYRCDKCGHVWTTKKGDSGQVTHVTPLKKPGKRRKGD